MASQVIIDAAGFRSYILFCTDIYGKCCRQGLPDAILIKGCVIQVTGAKIDYLWTFSSPIRFSATLVTIILRVFENSVGETPMYFLKTLQKYL